MRQRAAAAMRTACAAALALALAPSATAQGLYKWTDEKGKVHYTDKAPDERGGVVLDKQGRPVRTIEAPLTPEQERAREAENQRQRNAAKEQELANRRDRALLSSYTTEGEIDLAKARASATYEGQIQSAQAYQLQLAKRKKELDERKAKYVDKPLPTNLQHDSEVLDAEVVKNNELVTRMRRELQQVVARYDADKERWRELNAAAAREKKAAAPSSAASKK